MRAVMSAVGWLFMIVGVLTTVFSAFLALFDLGRRPHGIIIAVCMMGPVCLVPGTVSLLGSYLRGQSPKLTPRPLFLSKQENSYGR